MISQIFVFTDGGARGNPGPAAIGFVVKDTQGKTLAEVGKYIGRATNNVAEYLAVIEALGWIISNIKYQISNINFFLDSKLIVNQLNGYYKIKDAKLRNLIIEVRKLEQEIKSDVSYHFIPREKNLQADLLVNKNLSLRSRTLFLTKVRNKTINKKLV